MSVFFNARKKIHSDIYYVWLGLRLIPVRMRLIYQSASSKKFKSIANELKHNQILIIELGEV